MPSKVLALTRLSVVIDPEAVLIIHMLTSFELAVLWSVRTVPDPKRRMPAEANV